MPKKIGLLGAGYILDSHASALLQVPDVSLHAVCDVAAGRAAKAAAKYGIPHVFDGLKKLAASDCDVVHILLPPVHHIDAALALVDAGKSVFLEKPMGLDPAACNALADRAESRGVSAGVNHNFLFSRGYEALRRRVKGGELGRIDQVTVQWHYALRVLQFGPFDSWMLAAPANIVFELGSHLAAFLVDLAGVPAIASAVAANPLSLPGAQTVYRHWTAVGNTATSNTVFSISITAGQADRMIRVRCRGGSASLDFGRDIGWSDVTTTDNPIFDSYSVARSAAATLSEHARTDCVRRLKAALSKRPDANPFEESVFRSISAFYANLGGSVDSRHDPRFGTQIIEYCATVAKLAGAGSPSQSNVSVVAPQAKTPPTVLIVGGTGFIGRRLVRALIENGHPVRILTRNPRAAALEFQDKPVELFAGSHGDPQSIQRALQGISTVYHLAKCEGKRWQDYVDGDIEPTRVLAKAALVAGVKRFIYTGTIASYASANSRDVIDNRTPVDPAIERRSHYARSKAACEALLQALHRDSGLPLVILRPAIVIGPGSPPAHLGVGRFTSETRIEFWGEGTNLLPLVLVDDVADALLRALSAPGIEAQTLLLTSPPLMSAVEYVREVSRCMGATIESHPRSPWRNWLADMVKELAKNAVRHPNRRWPTIHDWQCRSHLSRYDGSMTETALGWTPVKTREALIERGIADAVRWYMS